MLLPPTIFTFFFFNDTSTPEIYTLSLHDAIPISIVFGGTKPSDGQWWVSFPINVAGSNKRSEEHTSELQSLTNLVCRLLLEKKKNEEINHLAAYASGTTNRWIGCRHPHSRHLNGR